MGNRLRKKKLTALQGAAILYLIAFLFSQRAVSQVNLQTGSATFTLPVFNWQDNRSRLNTAIALTYNSGNGLKVNEVASNAGQGWTLVSGGVISRMQVGEPDDQMPYGTAPETDLNKYPAGFLYASVPAGNGCPTALTKYPIYGGMNQLYKQHNIIAEDKQMDYFSFQFNGKTGLFVLDATNGDKGQILGDSRIKITFQRNPAMATGTSTGSRTSITSFTIQDVDGLIYKFTRHGRAKVLSSAFCDESLTYSQTQPKFETHGVYHQANFDNVTVNPWVINSWYLTEIEDPLTHRKVLFQYNTTNRTINAWAGQDIVFNEGDKDYCIIMHKKSIAEMPALSAVNFPDGHSVGLSYSAEQRTDLAGDYPLSAINVSYIGRTLSKFKLNTTYFIQNRYGTPTTPYQKKIARLCLKSVQKIGPDLKEENLPYIFDYYTGSNAPDDHVPPAFSHFKDIWGYYNGSNNVGWDYGEAIPLPLAVSKLSYSQLKGLCYLQRVGTNTVFTYFNSKPGYAKNGLLRQIIYPTGGTLTYTYQQNSGVINSTVQNTGGVHVYQTSTTDQGYSNGCDNPMITTYNYVLSDGTSSSLWGLEMPVSSRLFSTHYQPEYKYYKWTWSCAPFGCCDWKFKYPGILSQQQSVDLPGWINTLNSIAPAMGIIGTISLIKDIIVVCSGGNPVALIIDVILNLVQVGISCIGSHEKDPLMTAYYNSDLNSANPLPTQFKRVEVIENPGTRGKTIHEFTDDSFYPLWHATNPEYSAKQRYANWAYGLPKMITIKDANNNTVKQTEYIYSDDKAKELIGYCIINPKVPCYQHPSNLSTKLLSCQCTAVRTYSQRIDDWKQQSKYNDPATYITSTNSDLKVGFYGYYTGRMELRTVKERVYRTNDATQFLETQTSLLYDPFTYEVVSIDKTESDGNRIYKNIKHSDKLTGGVFDVMTQNNIVAVPIEISTMSLTSTGTAYLSSEVTEFIVVPSGDIKVQRKLVQRPAKPETQWWTGTWAQYNGPGNTDYTKYKVVQNYYYDASGNLAGVKDEGGRSINNLYSTTGKHIVAAIVNSDAATDEVAYADFEPESGWQGWSYQGGITMYSSNSITGARALMFQPYASFSITTDPAKKYIVSFWSGEPLVVTNAVLNKTVPGIGGYTYYEYEVPTGNTDVTISGAENSSQGMVLLDEVRLYPSTARMRTVSYDVVLGKISECDENNRIVYYEYDNSARLRFIKDEKKNIVKMYEYNTISPSKQNGCPGIYYNKMISETFTRDNCGAGYIGSDVTFTVPATTYSSTISQEDADAKAETYLLANGQDYANTNGTCIPIYYNTVQSQTFTSSCPPGYTAGTVTYTVPAGRYFSTVSQQAANQLALDEILANGQAYANDPAHASCVIDTYPQWEASDTAATTCMLVNGVMHKFIWATDVNPNSSTYGTSQWKDLGPGPDCNSTCTTVNCNGEGKKCIGGACTNGIKICIETVQEHGQLWRVTYHYYFQDGTYSQNYTEWVQFPQCAID